MNFSGIRDGGTIRCTVRSGAKRVVRVKDLMTMMKENPLRRGVTRKERSLHPKEEELAVFCVARVAFWRVSLAVFVVARVAFWRVFYFRNFTPACVLARGFRFDFAHIV